MRTPRNDPPLSVREAEGGSASSVRRCILTGEHDARAALTRLALSPDGVIVPDVMARAPGRGAWIGVDRPTLQTAMAKGRLKGALARAFKGTAVHVAEDLPDAIDRAFQREVLALLGLAAKAGVLLTGAAKVDVAARQGIVALLLHAADAADDGRGKRDQSWRVGSDAEGSGMAGLNLPVDRQALSVALGRDNAVHVAITNAGWAERLKALLERWHLYAGSSRGASHEDEQGLLSAVAGTRNAADYEG